MSDTCEACNGLRGHMRLKDLMCEEFEAEHTQAQQEYDRLNALFKDVCLYNFEIKCREWKHPWPVSLGLSRIELYGARISVDKSRGRPREIGEFPVYYEGSLKDAPELPPQILLKELNVAYEEMKRAFKQVTAPHDWAPGGRLYKELLVTTNVPTDLKRRSKRARGAAMRISKRVLENSHGDSD